MPRPVKGLEGKRVRLVSCSYYHTVVTTDEDEAYSFGRNDFGQVRLSWGTRGRAGEGVMGARVG